MVNGVAAISRKQLGALSPIFRPKARLSMEGDQAENMPELADRLRPDRPLKRT